MTSSAVVAVVLAAIAGTAHAEEAPPDHARHSTTLYLSTGWSPGPNVPIRIGAEAVLRAHRRHVAIEARLGAGGAASVIGLGGSVAGHAGVSLGGVLPWSRKVMLVPMIAYDVFVDYEQYGSTVVIHYMTFELPLSIVLDRGVVLEPFAQIGFARYQGVHDPVIVVGPRLGIVF